MHKVDSSNIDYISYDEEAKTLEVCFKSGSVYHYHEVPKHAFEGLLNSKSKGTHFAKHVKNAYKTVKQEKKDGKH